jgi:hypothetical protein
MTLMWEVRAAPGRIDELVAVVNLQAAASAQVFRADGPDPRVVVIDPTGQGVSGVPDELIARSPHSWDFEPVPRGDREP